MTQKPFEDLTISDDFMFCKVMEYAPICKEFLEILFSVKIEKITYLSPQNTVTTNSEAKTVRLDVLVKDKAGTSYDIEMQVGNEYNIPKRMRYYQSVLDVAFLDKGYSYKALNDSFIIFICLFDPIGSNKAIYTFENICIDWSCRRRNTRFSPESVRDCQKSSTIRTFSRKYCTGNRFNRTRSTVNWASLKTRLAF